MSELTRYADIDAALRSFRLSDDRATAHLTWAGRDVAVRIGRHGMTPVPVPDVEGIDTYVWIVPQDDGTYTVWAQARQRDGMTYGGRAEIVDGKARVRPYYRREEPEPDREADLARCTEWT